MCRCRSVPVIDAVIILSYDPSPHFYPLTCDPPVPLPVRLLLALECLCPTRYFFSVALPEIAYYDLTPAKTYVRL